MRTRASSRRQQRPARQAGAQARADVPAPLLEQQQQGGQVHQRREQPGARIRHGSCHGANDTGKGGHAAAAVPRTHHIRALGDTIGLMNKAFVKESDNDDDEEALALAQQIPAGSKNYITPAGYKAIKDELLQLIDVDRPEVVRVVHWAASNGDRSENGDYIYGKRRLREIDRRIRFLTKRLDSAFVVDPSVHHGNDQVFFGATVAYLNKAGEEHTVTIVGIDEFDPLRGQDQLGVAGGARADQGARGRRRHPADAAGHGRAGNPQRRLSRTPYGLIS
jgi:transcription elongation factor GreB